VPIRKKEISKTIRQFARFAHEYDRYNLIQAEVARLLVSKLSRTQYSTILDIGCGSGEVYKNIQKCKIDFDTFLALDASKEMLALHPNDSKTQKICADFNVMGSIQKLNLVKDRTLLISSSALQWSEDLNFVFSELSSVSTKAYFAIFTANTFKTLHQTAKLHSPIYSENLLKETIEKYYQATFELQQYTLEFKTAREMLHYIKKSGVSGGEKQLTFKKTKQLLNTYPLDYLEFEVLFVEAISLAD